MDDILARNMSTIVLIANHDHSPASISQRDIFINNMAADSASVTSEVWVDWFFAFSSVCKRIGISGIAWIRVSPKNKVNIYLSECSFNL